MASELPHRHKVRVGEGSPSPFHGRRAPLPYDNYRNLARRKGHRGEASRSPFQGLHVALPYDNYRDLVRRTGSGAEPLSPPDLQSPLMVSRNQPFGDRDLATALREVETNQGQITEPALHEPETNQVPAMAPALREAGEGGEAETNQVRVMVRRPLPSAPLAVKDKLCNVKIAFRTTMPFLIMILAICLVFFYLYRSGHLSGILRTLISRIGVP